MIEIIAEGGINHQGDFNTACRLVEAAIDAGCTAFKTQIFDSERVYQGEKIAEMKKLELGRRGIRDLKAYCDGRGIELIVTPDEIQDARFLKEIGLKRIKTSSQDVTNLLFLGRIDDLGLPVILSTGACTWDELDAAVLEVMGCLSPGGAILHCVSAYPAPLDQMNLRIISRLCHYYGARMGLSDHTEGCEAAMLALALGATVFEKHLTLDKNQSGPDHAASMTPVELRGYVLTLKRCESALGDGDKRVMPCEEENREKFLRFVEYRKGLPC